MGEVESIAAQSRAGQTRAKQSREEWRGVERGREDFLRSIGRSGVERCRGSRV